ncbi:copper amine oxidase N-terminal domain-containing protein [Peptoniphilus vaginalis]|uniref:copper amine oxidase N-terminal domain-containing protein n=1 Tax=Peptoniphilus vaginalis TaxID=1756987 RepID=UPI0023F74D19|nr:copper amine oxidase N-terminal domain-containing protein [Peptoniphilus vaginalis]
MNLNQLKKYFLISLSLASLLTINAFAEGERDFQITVNTKEIPLNNNVGMPFVEYDRTFVPIRVISENLGYKVDWNQDKKLVTINGNKKVELVVGETSAKVQGNKVAIDSAGKVASVLKNNRTYVPLRFVSEQMGAKVDYKQTPKLHIINITKDGVQVAQNDAPEGYLRPGETKDDVLRRAKAKYTEGNAPGKVSDKWIDPDLRAIYIDPFNNNFGVQLPFGFGVYNYKQFKGMDPNKYWVKIEIDDDRFIPYNDHFEMATGENQWGQMKKEDIAALSKKYPLDNDGSLIAPFQFFDYSKFSGTILRTKGYNRVVSPYHGDVIDYKATIHQDGEEHVYKFKVVYGRVMTDYTLNKYVPKDQRAYQKNVFEKTNFYNSKDNYFSRRLPLNWEQVK